jgi:hypothetical protein
MGKLKTRVVNGVTITEERSGDTNWIFDPLAERIREVYRRSAYLPPSNLYLPQTSEPRQLDSSLYECPFQGYRKAPSICDKEIERQRKYRTLLDAEAKGPLGVNPEELDHLFRVVNEQFRRKDLVDARNRKQEREARKSEEPRQPIRQRVREKVRERGDAYYRKEERAEAARELGRRIEEQKRIDELRKIHPDLIVDASMGTKHLDIPSYRQPVRDRVRQPIRAETIGEKRRKVRAQRGDARGLRDSIRSQRSEEQRQPT